jgi:hypothetical protein
MAADMLSRPPTDDKREQNNNDLILLPEEMFIQLQTDIMLEPEYYDLEQKVVQAQKHRNKKMSQTEVVTPEVLDHVTVGRSCDQIRSKSSHDQVPDLVPRPSDNKSDDKEREHTLMHAYFCRCDLCYVHDRY